MPDKEIKTAPIWKLDIHDEPVYSFGSQHTLNDILRHVLKETGDTDEFLFLCGQVALNDG